MFNCIYIICLYIEIFLSFSSVCLDKFFDGQAQAWPFSVFTPEQVFGPRTVKS